MGRGRAERFARCCSGKLYNITNPTTPEDEAYPMSCATFCQIDPERAEANKKYPYGWDDHFMCLLGDDEESNWEVTCATITVEGKPMPTSFESTPTGPWMTSDYSTWFWFQDADATEEPAQDTAVSTGGVGVTYISSIYTGAIVTSSSTRSSAPETSATIDFAQSTNGPSTLPSPSATETPTSKAGSMRLPLKASVSVVLLVSCFLVAAPVT